MWCHLDEKQCPCQGVGWHKLKEWEKCFVHYRGQLHPESRQLLLDDSSLKEEERKSYLAWLISSKKEEAEFHLKKLNELQLEVAILEKELINKTPTIKMKAIQL